MASSQHFLRAFMIAFLALIPLQFFFPTGLKGPGRLEQLAEAGSLGKEMLRVYSMIKLNRSDVEESHAWDMAKTIARESRSHAIDPMLVLAVINVESRFRPEAVSEKGARGLMQIRPEAAADLAQKPDPTPHAIAGSLNPKLLHDPTTNIKIGVSYLSYLHKRFRNLRVALMAYNWGPTKIQKTLDEKQSLPEDYAKKVLSTYETYRAVQSAPPKAPWKAA
jgi:soluble lytic murein transglycosylase